MSILVLLVAILAVTPLVNSIEFTSVVKIDSGQLRGYIRVVNNTGGLKVRGYLAIPFARAERFQPPEPPKSWDGVKDMVTLGKACPQMLSAFGSPTREDISEDCLHLNVYVPDDISNSSALPVMVWIYGGAFVVGANRVYDGGNIATRGKVVVVAINYRVSVFGFLTNGKDGDIKGNYGMLDQVEALKWVKRNIAAFNGDPNQVTIFGESAGGASVSLLLLSKLTKGLFHRAIPQSGDASAFWGSGTYEHRTKSMKAFAKNVGCPEDLSKLRDCLEPKDAMAIINASLAVPWPNFVPVIDDHFLDDDPKILYQKQDFEKYDIMIGVTNDEGTVFTNAVAGLGEGLNVTNGVSREVFVGVIRGGGLSTVIPDPKSVLINASIHEYTDYTQVSSPITNRRMYMDMMGDVGFVAPAIRGANAYAKKKAVTYFYSFDHRHGDAVMGSKVPSWVRAYHGADISFVFGAPLLDPATTPTDANFTRDILKMWTNFAKTGDPNKPDSLGVTWPVYTLEEQKYMSLKPNMAVHSHLRANYIAFWNEFVPNALHAARRPKQHPCGRGEDRKATAALVLMLSLLTTWF
ncbi:neuroligin-4, X-linked [Exaiptasia diaphana]|uniref:Carboxylesterase type B domain-containing protein n=1 Tax=Exaiptasia diaphana TaxID=2652724 RepID=A0A913XLI5_EXADI|nr:neuroligin-4, X-linked [Exaiptasia diaphana]